MASKMTKAERIYEDSKRAIRTDVHNGTFYDALSRLEYGKGEIICMRTINAMQRLWEADVRMFERDVRWVERHPDMTGTSEHRMHVFAVRCETLRRLGLTIRNARNREVAWKRLMRDEITFEEYNRVA